MCCSPRITRSPSCSIGPRGLTTRARLGMGRRPPRQPVRGHLPLVRRLDRALSHGFDDQHVPDRPARLELRAALATADGTTCHHPRRDQQWATRSRPRHGRRFCVSFGQLGVRRQTCARGPLRGRPRLADQDPGRRPVTTGRGPDDRRTTHARDCPALDAGASKFPGHRSSWKVRDAA